MPFFVVQQRMAKKIHQAVPAWIPLYTALAMLSQGSGENIVFLNINARRAYTAHVGLIAKKHEILFTKTKIYPSPEDSKASVLDKTENSKIIGSCPTKRNSNFNGRDIESIQFLQPKAVGRCLTHGKVLYTRYFRPSLALHSEGAEGSKGEVLGSFLSQFLDEYQEIA